MIYKLIIADDEAKLIDLIRILGHWDKLNIEIVDECKNGADALESIIRNEPDIALLDIMMPVYDGISIIEKAKALGISTVFIIISRYRHFEYAKSAIQLGVIDYLLKPLDEENLNMTLQKACNRVYKEKSNNNNHRLIQAMSQQKQADAQNALWDYTLSGIQRNKAQIDFNELRPLISLPFESPILVCLAIKSNVDNLLTNNGSLFEDKLVAFMHQTLGVHCSYIYHCDVSGFYALLALKHERQLTALDESLHLLYEKICQLYEIYGPFNFRIGYSYVRHDPSMLPETMLQAQAAMVGASSHVRVYSFPESLIHSSSKAYLLSEQEYMNLQRAIQHLDDQTIHELFEKVKSKHLNMRNASTIELLRFLHQILSFSYSLFKPNSTYDSSRHILCILAQENFDKERIINHIKNDILSLVNEKAVSQEQRRSQAIQKAERYIQQNYSKPISLEEVAEAVGLSSTYFSKLFKQELGIGFSTYLTGIRLETSQKMLIETNLSCKIISERIGYADEKYFQKLFKKQIGVTPSEYRKLFQ